MWFALSVLACIAPVDFGDDSARDTAPPDDSGHGSDSDSPRPRDTDEEPVPGDSREEIPGDTSPPPEDTSPEPPHDDTEADFFFAQDVIHTVDFTISEENAKALRKDGRTYVEADVTVDGETLTSVGVKLKGSSSYRDLNGKAAFKVDLNQYVAGQDFHGLKKLTLNNMLNDETQLHEAIGYAAYAAAGLPHNRTSYAWVTVNGLDYGLYLNMETPDSGMWMRRNFGEEEGRLYEGGYPEYPDSMEHADFTPRESLNFELEAGDDVDNEDVIAAAEAVVTFDADWDSTVDALIDLDEFAGFMVGETWVGQWDGYVYASNNFRIYVSGADGRVNFLPSGLDWSFTDYTAWDQPQAVVASTCWHEPSCRERLRARAAEVCDAVDAAGLVDQFDALQALIQPYIEADPRRELQMGKLTKSQATMRVWVEDRCTEVREVYGVE